MENRWKSVSCALSEFKKYLAPDFPDLKIVHLYDFSLSEEDYKVTRKERSAVYNLPGVYLFYDEQGKLLYVGKASWTFDKRVWKHPEITDARYIDVIPFDWAVSPFCLALEYFLISKLNPEYNKHARGYGYAE